MLPRPPSRVPPPVEPWEDAPRVDALEKVTGRARYLEDLPDLPGMVYAAALRSPHSHARVLHIDATPALALPGVLGVLDRDHLDGLNPRVRVGEYRGHTGEHGLTADQHFLTDDKARFDGDLLGMVAASDLATARRAVELIRVEYEVLPAVFSVADALAPGAPLLHEDLRSNLACEDSFAWGEVERGFREADHVWEEEFYTGHAFHHPIEPAGGCIAYFANDAADLWLASNKPFSPGAQIAELFGIDADNVRVRVPYLGGAFGSKQLTPAIMGALALSRRLGRPVKLVPTEAESFRATARHAQLYRGRVGVRADGTLVALDVRLDVDTGAYFTGARVVTRNMCISAWGCYRLPHFRVRARTAYTNKVPAASFRATGKTQTTFAVECLMDAVARRLGISPRALRERNVLNRGEHIASVWRVRGQECPADTPPLDTDYHELMQRAVDGIGWDGSAGGCRNAPGSPVARGRGLALSLRHGAQGGGRTYAMVSVDAHGLVKVLHAAPDLGEGTYTMISVVAARTLGIPQSQVKIAIPDTSHDLDFEGSAAQRTTVAMGNTVRAACEALKRELVGAVVEVRGGTPEEWRVEGGRLWRGEESYSFAEIVRAFSTAPAFEGVVSIKALGSYSYPPSRDRAFGAMDHWAPGAAAVEVAVDRDTGEVRILKLSAVADAGKALHHLAAQSQVEGGAIMGVGLGLFEDLIYADGRLRNADPFLYRLPRMGDLPPPEAFAAGLVEHGDGPGPFGAKGMSQTSIPCLAPAINNAIADAISVALPSVPFSPEKVLRALGALDDAVSEREADAGA